MTPHHRARGNGETCNEKIPCPYCGADLGRIVPIGIVAESFPHTMRRIILALSTGRPMTRDQIADQVYWDDPNGGPDTAKNVVSVTISNHRGALAGMGWRIQASPRSGYRLVRDQ